MTPGPPPVTVPSAPASPTSDVIEVIGKRGDGELDVDRRTYQVRQTPQVAQKDLLDLLRALPAVTVTPQDKVQVLGARISRLYVDGRPYLGDIGTFLHSLHGSDIARIEVMANPSAQFAAQGAGGVINLILRKTARDGLSGNAGYQVSSYAHALADTTLDYRKGDWTYQLKVAANVGSMLNRKVNEVRRSQAAQGSASAAFHARGMHESGGADARITGKAAYSLDSKTTVSAQLMAGGGHDTISDTLDYAALTPDFVPFREHSVTDSYGMTLNGQVDLDHDVGKRGEVLSASVQFYTNTHLHDITQARYSDARRYRIDLWHPAGSLDARVDWKHPLAKNLRLSLGGAWHVDTIRQNYRFTSNDAATLGENTANAYHARSTTLAAYVSVQQTLGSLTLAPGLRFEANRRIIDGDDDTSLGIAELSAGRVRIDRTKLFPSFHASLKVSKALQLRASYSKRIDRVPLEYLASYGAVQDAYTVFQGNPALKDENIDAYEAGVRFKPGRIEANATLYLRETRGLWSESYAVNTAGTSVYTYVNAGRRRDVGGQFDLSSPLLARVKVRASISLFDERTPVGTDGSGAFSQNVFRYSTNGALEWSGADRAGAREGKDHVKTPGDVAQLQWSYNSPSRSYQVRKGSWFDASVSYTHSFTPTLSLSGTFRYSGTSREDLTAPLVEQSVRRRRIPEFQLKLHKTL